MPKISIRAIAEKLTLEDIQRLIVLREMAG